MTPVRLALIATAAAGLMAIAAPASAEVVATPDGQYYRLVPVRTPGPGAAPEMVNRGPWRTSPPPQTAASPISRTTNISRNTSRSVARNNGPLVSYVRGQEGRRG